MWIRGEQTYRRKPHKLMNSDGRTEVLKVRGRGREEFRRSVKDCIEDSYFAGSCSVVRLRTL